MLLWSAPHLWITEILAQEVGSLYYCACYPRATPAVAKFLELGHKPAGDTFGVLPHIAGLLKHTVVPFHLPGLLGYNPFKKKSRSRIHERTITLRFLGIILKVLRLVSVWIF
jgi:hypothetical protein